MKAEEPTPIAPPEKPTRMIPQRGPDEGYDWDRPDVFPAEPEGPEPATARLRDAA